MSEPGKNPRKPLFWVGSSRDDVREFPDSIKKIIGFALALAQEGGKHEQAKPLKGFGGGGVLEIVENRQGNAYRAIYTVRFGDAVYALHAFQKKSRRGIKTAKHDIDLVKSRLDMARKDYRQRFAPKENTHD